MIRLIKENAITDLRNILKNEVNFDEYPMADVETGRYDTEYHHLGRQAYTRRGKFKPDGGRAVDKLINWIQKTLKDYYTYDFNTNDLKLTKVPKPSGSTKAKKNPNYLLGIDTTSGDAVLIGKGQFFEFFSGEMGYANSNRYSSNGVPENPRPDYEMKHTRVSFRDLWDTLDLWFEIAPEDESTYQTRSEIRKAENRDYYNQALRDIERELYDVDYARERYARRLKVVKTRKQYESLLNEIENINERIRSINFGHPIFGGGAKLDRRDIDNLRDYYDNAKYYLEDLTKSIEEGDDWTIEYRAEYLQKAYEKLNNLLSDKFGV